MTFFFFVDTQWLFTEKNGLLQEFCTLRYVIQKHHNAFMFLLFFSTRNLFIFLCVHRGKYYEMVFSLSYGQTHITIAGVEENWRNWSILITDYTAVAVFSHLLYVLLAVCNVYVCFYDRSAPPLVYTFFFLLPWPSCPCPTCTHTHTHLPSYPVG